MCGIAALGVVLLLVLGACATPTPSPLPPYKNPGSWLAVEAGFRDWNSTTDTLMIALWDGNTGDNYTTIINENHDFIDFIVNPTDRLAALVYQPLNVYNQSTIALFKYAPRSAPSLFASCQMPFYASLAIAFTMNRQLYAFSDNILYGVEMPTGHNPNQVCEITVLLPIPTEFTGFCSLSLTPNHASYINGDMLVELWWDQNGNVTVTSQHAPGGGTWLWLQEDTMTNTFYFYTTNTNYVSTFWKGARNTTNGPVTWSVMKAWKGRDPGGFAIDSRYEKLYDGPLFCSTDSISDSYCWTLNVDAAWNGPQLQDAFFGDGGAVSYTMYDPNCN